MIFKLRVFHILMINLFFYCLSASQAFSLTSPGVSCVNRYNNETLDFTCEQGIGTVWYNDNVYRRLPCRRLPASGPGERGPYGGQIGSEHDNIYLSFGLGSYGQRVYGHIYDNKIVPYDWDYCAIN